MNSIETADSISEQKEPDTYSVPEAGRRVGLGKNASYAAAQRGELPVLRFGRKLRVPLQNLVSLAFDTHLFLREGPRAISTLELPAAEVKNRTELSFDIPSDVARMLIEYRDQVASKIIGHRPSRLFVTIAGTPKGQLTVAYLITSYLRHRAGIVLTPHQFRHLSAKVVLDAEPGSFETVKQFLGHKSLKTTVAAYAGIDSRRAARRHYQLVEQALAAQMPARRRKRRAS